MYAVPPIAAPAWSELPEGRWPIASAAPVRGSTLTIVSICDGPVPPPKRKDSLPIVTAAASCTTPGSRPTPREPERETVTMSSRDVSAAVRPPSSTAPPPNDAAAASCTGRSSVPASIGTSRRIGSGRTAFCCREVVVAEVETPVDVGAAAREPPQPTTKLATTASRNSAGRKLIAQASGRALNGS